MYNDKGEVPEDDYVIPLGKADVKRQGSDLSLIAHGPSVLVCLEAADILSSEHGIEAEVVDRNVGKPDVQLMLIMVYLKTIIRCTCLSPVTQYDAQSVVFS